jgi:amino acid transporter
MAKIKLLPSFFMKTNKKGAPYVGILAVGGSILLIVATGLSTTDQLSFIILTGCVFWMVTYIIAHIDVLILRKRMPKVPRTFKVPLGPVLPVIGIIGIMWMIYNIAFDPSVRVEIYKTTSVIFTILAVYAVVWIKVVMKVKLFKPFAVKDVMAMENELYHAVRDKNYIPEENANNAANTAVE